ncbi:hypothetical protein GT025_00400 [Streptomyces sp. SID4920]|nr:hypothetical protein [Streptomyces sp. SID4920]MYX64255.1 hypothetical protein [Streptomyces sp. SID8373]
MTVTGSSRSWGPGLASRAAGVALAAVMVVASGAFARTLAREGFAWDTLLMLATLVWIRSRISTDHGTCGSNAFPARVIFGWPAHEGGAPW